MTMTLETLEKANRLASRIETAKRNIDSFKKANLLNLTLDCCSREPDPEVEVINDKIKEFGGKALAAHLSKLESQFKAL